MKEKPSLRTSLSTSTFSLSPLSSEVHSISMTSFPEGRWPVSLPFLFSREREVSSSLFGFFPGAGEVFHQIFFFDRIIFFSFPQFTFPCSSSSFPVKVSFFLPLNDMDRDPSFPSVGTFYRRSSPSFFEEVSGFLPFFSAYSSRLFLSIAGNSSTSSLLCLGKDTHSFHLSLGNASGFSTGRGRLGLRPFFPFPSMLPLPSLFSLFSFAGWRGLPPP